MMNTRPGLEDPVGRSHDHPPGDHGWVEQGGLRGNITAEGE